MLRTFIINHHTEFHSALIRNFHKETECCDDVMSDIWCVQDKPWVYAHLLEIQRRVGRENFPLIEQVFYPSHSGMVRLHMDTLHCTAALTLVPLHRTTRAATHVSSKSDTPTGAWARSE